MHHACAVKFDVTENFKNFLDFGVNKTQANRRDFLSPVPPYARAPGDCRLELNGACRGVSKSGIWIYVHGLCIGPCVLHRTTSARTPTVADRDRPRPEEKMV